MFGQLLLILLLFFVALELGAGLYETLVVHPAWKHSTNKNELKATMEASGQLRSGKRLWPFVSPVVAVLAIANLVSAWNYTGDARSFWLGAAVVALIDRVITFAYFVPTLSKLQTPRNTTDEQLRHTIKLWISLSPLRALSGVACWGLGAYALGVIA